MELVMYSQQRIQLKRILKDVYRGYEQNCDGWRVRMVGPYIAIEQPTHRCDVTCALRYKGIAWHVYSRPGAISLMWAILRGASHRKPSAFSEERVGQSKW